MIPRLPLTRLAAGAGTAAAALVLLTTPAFATAVVNGGFESPMAQSPFTPNTTVLDGWTVTPDIDHIGTYWQAAEGVQSIDLNGCQPSTISQTVPTSAGSHTLQFTMAGNPDLSPVVKTLTVTTTSGAAITTQNFSFDTTGATRPAMNWATKQLAFVAEGPTTIQFESTTEGCYGPALDNVVVQDDPNIVVNEAPFAILLPASAAAIGAAGYFGARMRRKKLAR